MLSATVPTVVMMDDLGQAPPAVQAAVMQLILARQINGRQISDHVSFIAATNRREDKAAVKGFIAPLLDRFTCVVPMEFDLDEWVAWGIRNNMPVELLAFARLQPTAILGYRQDPEGRGRRNVRDRLRGIPRGTQFSVVFDWVTDLDEQPRGVVMVTTATRATSATTRESPSCGSSPRRTAGSAHRSGKSPLP